jgi:uncharacterized protein (DUF1800 family)
MAVSNQLRNQHLLWRAGFGPMAEQLNELSVPSQQAFVKALFKSSAKAPSRIEVASNVFNGLTMGVDDISKQARQLSADEKKMIRERSRKDLKSLNIFWLNEMVNSEQQLLEKMALFWHGHFASKNINILYQQQLLHLIRTLSLANFGDLLREVSKSAAMINFLNNNQNRKGHPNENFAREVMELFTMGRGNYSETDVKEAARAFTGWGAELSGEFVFCRQLHDAGQKTFLGKSGNFDGDDILDIILEQKQTAVYITQKIYRFFVNENIDKNKTQWLADRFYQSNYDISALMHDIFSSDWFYAQENVGNRIKSPVELIAGMRRTLPMEIENEEIQLLLQRLLGQLLFYPPNVAGWPGGKNWIDSSSLMLRLRIPQLMSAGDQLDMKPKDDDDQMMGRNRGVLKQVFATTIDWKEYTSKFQQVPHAELASTIGRTLLQTTENIPETLINRFADDSSRENYIKSATLQLMSMPEYQLC